MHFVVPAVLLIVALIHALPLMGVVSGQKVASLYGIVVQDPNLEILMRHRAVLFGLLAGFLAYAAFHRPLHSLALVAGGVSVVAFLALAVSVGHYNAAVSTVLKADLLALALLVIAAAVHRLGPRRCPMAKLRVESFTISLDGFGAGPRQSLENPLGIGGTALHGWAMATKTFQSKVFGSEGGATGIDDDFAAQGFRDVGAWILGREAAQGRDVRVGGGVGVIRQCLRKRLIDEMHIAVSPVLLGSGERLFEGVDLPALGYACIRHDATPLATHLIIVRQ